MKKPEPVQHEICACVRNPFRSQVVPQLRGVGIVIRTVYGPENAVPERPKPRQHSQTHES